MAQPIEIPDCAKKLLEFLYPTVDWSRVVFFSGLPWWAPSGTTAITIANPLGGLGYRVYLGTNTNFCDDATINTLMHESMHLQQFINSEGGYGLGFLRWGFFNYFVCYFANGFKYDENPFEQQAYEQERAFARCHTTKVCDCTTGNPVLNPAALDALARCNPALIIGKPTTPYCGSWWAFLLALIVVPILAILVFIVHLFDLLNCTYLQTQSEQCTEWARRTREECNEWADRGQEQCTQWADEGYSTCSQWADHGYNRCCTWWPCSWACRALVWVSKWVCMLTVWIAKWVCKVAIWIANWICLVVVTIIEWACVATITVFKLIFFCWLR